MPYLLIAALFLLMSGIIGFMFHWGVYGYDRTIPLPGPRGLWRGTFEPLPDKFSEWVVSLHDALPDVSIIEEWYGQLPKKISIRILGLVIVILQIISYLIAWIQVRRLLLNREQTSGSLILFASIVGLIIAAVWLYRTLRRSKTSPRLFWKTVILFVMFFPFAVILRRLILSFLYVATAVIILILLTGKFYSRILYAIALLLLLPYILLRRLPTNIRMILPASVLSAVSIAIVILIN